MVDSWKSQQVNKAEHLTARYFPVEFLDMNKTKQEKRRVGFELALIRLKT